MNIIVISDEHWISGNVVFWSIRVLFEPVRLGDRIPVPMVAVSLSDGDSANWPLNPIAIVDDGPFMVGHRIGMGGLPENPTSHINWARRHGVLRDEPLRPTTNPVAAAETLLKSRRFKQLDEYSRDVARRLVRSQALSMLREPLSSAPLSLRDDAAADRQWNEAVRKVNAQRLHWDTSQESFLEAQTRRP